MTPPGVAAERFVYALLLGAALGIGYGLLHPPGRRKWLGDLIFVLLALWAWADLAFRACRGDVRMADLGGLAAGAAGSIALFGSIFASFWSIMAVPVKKISDFAKKIVCICGKMGYNED